jgi:hypothetical protein
MIKDAKLVYSDAQAVTASAASASVLDHQAAGDALGMELYLVVLVDTTADSAGDAATVQVALQTSSDEAFTSPVTLIETAAIAQASVTAGAYLVKAKLPIGLLRYSRVYFTIGTENLTAGKFDAFLTPNVEVR